MRIAPEVGFHWMAVAGLLAGAARVASAQPETGYYPAPLQGAVPTYVQANAELNQPFAEQPSVGELVQRLEQTEAHLAALQAERFSAVDATMERFPLLAERQSQLAGTLSGGQQQILLMARALMGRPRLMMIDEPSLGLSPQATDQVFEIISGLKDEGITVLLIEQNVERGLEAADWAFVLDLGRVRFEGPHDQILDDQRIRELYLGKAPSP